MFSVATIKENRKDGKIVSYYFTACMGRDTVCFFGMKKERYYLKKQYFWRSIYYGLLCGNEDTKRSAFERIES